MAKKPKRQYRPAARRRRTLAGSAQMARLPARQTLDLDRCEQFLLQEARLLDDGKFDDWLALFALEAWYWVPSEPNQADPVETVSLIYDDRRLLETRVRVRAASSATSRSKKAARIPARYDPNS
jgi:hypothetical protein